MSEDKGLPKGSSDAPEETPEDDLLDSNAASRARNKTVMLSPEIAGKVRAQLVDDFGDEAEKETQELMPSFKGSGEEESEREGDFVRGDAMTSIQVVDDWQPAGSISVPSSAQLPSSEQSDEPPAAPASAPVSTESGDFQLVSKEEESKLIGFLVTYDKNENGDMMPLRVGRWLLP